jgi:glycosyltransferase involved in cell wall biosynthesis
MSKKVFLLSTFTQGAYSHVIRKVLMNNGYRVMIFDPRNSIQRNGQAATNRELVQLLDLFEPDVLLALKGRGIDEKIIANAPFKTVNWWLDHYQRYSDFHKYYEAYDKTYLCESDQGYDWMSIGIDPELHKPTPSEVPEFQSDVVFAGTAHTRRTANIVNILRNMPWDSKIWGNGWNKDIPIWQGRAAYWQELMAIYTNSKIVLNSHYHKGITPNMRCIEAPAAGTMMLSDTGSGLESVLKMGTEYVPYSSTREAKQMIAKYLEETDEREKIAHAGYERVISDHLLINKLEAMFK